MLQNGAMDYIIKPFKIHRIQQALEKYRAYRNRLDTTETVSQEQLDILLYTEKMTETIKTDLPKGLNEFTLNEITTYIQNQNRPRSAEEVAGWNSIASVTARRYLDYLEKSNGITLDIQYTEGLEDRSIVMYPIMSKNKTKTTKMADMTINFSLLYEALSF